MSYVIKAVLCSAQQPEYGEATVCFPIPDAQYDRTARLLEAAKMGAALVQDCQVNEIDSFYRVLDSLKGTTATMEGYTDFERMGEDVMRAEGVRQTEFGLIRRISAPFPEEADQSFQIGGPM